MDGKQELNYEWNLSEETKKIAKDELREDNTIREQLLEQFRHWISKHPFIKNCRTDSVFLLRFLRTKKFSLPIAQQMFEKYFTIKKLYPDWFQNLSMDEPEIEAIINDGYIVPLLKRDNNGRMVVIFNIGRFNPYKYTTAQMVRVHSITFEALMEDEENQVRGFTYIMDESGLTMGHISAWSFLDVRRLLYSIQDGLPMRHKHSYIVNIPTYGVKFFDVCISYLNKKLKERCTVHKSINELKDVIDLKSLPTEYGGEVPITKLIDSLKQTIRKNQELIKVLNDTEIDITSSNSQFYCKEMDGISGSFRKLEVD